MQEEIMRWLYLAYENPIPFLVVFVGLWIVGISLRK